MGLNLTKYHTSVYTIFVKTNDDDGYILVHGYTGAIDFVNNRIAAWLRQGGGYRETNSNDLGIQESTIDVLIKRGYLTEKSPFEERAKVAEMANIFHQRDSRKSNFLFLVAYDCNFRCPYCFENAISSNGKGWSKKVFTRDAVDRAYAAMEEIEPDKSQHVKTITLYGGEPLLIENKSIIEYIVENGIERGYNFKAITNGYDVDQFLHLLGPGKIGRLQITIDGKKEHHNARRTHYLYGNSYDKIMQNVDLALKMGVVVNIRINTDLENFEHLNELNHDFKRFGFTGYKTFSVSSSLIHGGDDMNCNSVMVAASAPAPEPRKAAAAPDLSDPDQYIDFDREQEWFLGNGQIQFHDEMDDSSDKIITMNRGKYIDKYISMVKKDPSLEMISCQDFGIRSKIKNVLEGKGLVYFTSVFCSAQTGMIIFDPCGDLYSCWETVGVDQHIVGTYKDKVVFDDEELNNWYKRNISTVTACSKCKYAFFCGGGCQAHALTEGRGYNAPYCDGYAATFQRIVPEVYEQFSTTQLSNH